MIKLKKKLGLKAVLIMMVLPILFSGCDKKETDFYTSIELKEGLPDALKTLEKDLPFKNFTYADLNTGTDSLQVFFGSFMQGSTRGHWFGIESNGQPAHFSTLSLEEVDSLNYPTKDIEIEFNNDRNRIGLRVMEVDSLTVKYSWLDNLELSKKIALKSIEKPLRINEQFPDMNLETLEGEPVSSRDFEGQFVVINWWATWCAPCIKEIPGLNKIVEKYGKNGKVKFIAITNDPKDRITSFLKSRSFDYEMTFANQVVQDLFGNSYPVNMIIDPTGKITYLREGAGPQTPSEIEASLRQQLEMFNSGELAMAE